MNFSYSQIDFSFTSGIGYSNTNRNIENSMPNEMKFRISPVFISSFEYSKINSKIGIGISYAFDKSNWTIGFFKPNQGILYTNSTLNRNNISAKITYDLIQNEMIDLYTGIRMGFSKYVSTYYTQINYLQSQGYYEMSNNYSDSYVLNYRETLSYQLLIGSKVHFNRYLGIYAELGIGNAPCLFNSGILISI